MREVFCAKIGITISFENVFYYEKVSMATQGRSRYYVG
jgi:hypothetical protein